MDEDRIKMDRKIIAAWSSTVLICILSGVFLIGCPFEEPKEPEEMVIFAANEEFIVEAEGLILLEENYNLTFDQVHEMAVGLTHEALRAEDVEAAVGFTTDGKIKELELTKLEDDLEVFPASNPAPVIREEVLEQYPQIKSIMAEIASQLDNQAMIRLNYRADLEEKEPAGVARDWLLEKKLITEEARMPVEGEPVIVSSKEFMEQQILGQIAIIALENAGISVEEQKPIAGTGAIRRSIMLDNIDLYWEYTGAVWHDIYEKEEIISDPDQLYQRVAEKDTEKGLIWLDKAPLNKTYTIMMRREHARELGITTISEFAQWVEQVRAGELQ